MDMPWLFWGNLLEESTRFRCRVPHQVLKAEVSLINKKERKGNKAKGQCGKRLKGEHQWQQASHVIGAKGLLTGYRQVAPHRGSMFRSFEVISWPTLMHSFIKKHFEGIIFQMKVESIRWLFHHSVKQEILHNLYRWQVPRQLSVVQNPILVSAK